VAHPVQKNLGKQERRKTRADVRFPSFLSYLYKLRVRVVLIAAASAKDAQQEQEQVDKVKIQGQRT
jgi:hypothetical protein